MLVFMTSTVAPLLIAMLLVATTVGTVALIELRDVFLKTSVPASTLVAPV